MDERDGATRGGLGRHVANHHAPGAAREAAVGDQAHAFAQSCANQRAGGGQHFGHAGAAFGAQVAQDHHVAGHDAARQNGFERGLLVLEHAGRAGHHGFFQAGDFGHGAFGREVAF